jgi:hypothetical protein
VGRGPEEVGEGRGKGKVVYILQIGPYWNDFLSNLSFNEYRYPILGTLLERSTFQDLIFSLFRT